MCTMAKPSSPTPDNIRLTITVTPEVHAAFTRMADASGLSLGRCMGEWLADTLEGVEFVTAQMVKAREAPRQVAREIRQMALGAVDLADDLLTDLRAGRKPGAGAAGGALPAAAGTPPRLVIRGGKSTTGKAKGHK